MTELQEAMELWLEEQMRPGPPAHRVFGDATGAFPALEAAFLGTPALATGDLS